MAITINPSKFNIVAVDNSDYRSLFKNLTDEFITFPRKPLGDPPGVALSKGFTFGDSTALTIDYLESEIFSSARDNSPNSKVNISTTTNAILGEDSYTISNYSSSLMYSDWDLHSKSTFSNIADELVKTYNINSYLTNIPTPIVTGDMVRIQNNDFIAINSAAAGQQVNLMAINFGNGISIPTDVISNGNTGTSLTFIDSNYSRNINSTNTFVSNSVTSPDWDIVDIHIGDFMYMLSETYGDSTKSLNKPDNLYKVIGKIQTFRLTIPINTILNYKYEVHDVNHRYTIQDSVEMPVSLDKTIFSISNGPPATFIGKIYTEIIKKTIEDRLKSQLTENRYRNGYKNSSVSKIEIHEGSFPFLPTDSLNAIPIVEKLKPKLPVSQLELF